MKNILAILIGAILITSVVSCSTTKSLKNPPSATTSGPRTIILDGDSLSEGDLGDFESWICWDKYNGGPVLVEVGYYGVSGFDVLGFVLFDGGYSGKSTLHERTGLNHRWDWGYGANYSFIIKPDGTGLYYDFSTVPEGETTTARDVYKCKKRN